MYGHGAQRGIFHPYPQSHNAHNVIPTNVTARNGVVTSHRQIISQMSVIDKCIIASHIVHHSHH